MIAIALLLAHGAYLPDSGQIFASGTEFVDDRAVLGAANDELDDELVAHLVRTTPLSENEARRVVAEVLRYFDEPLEVFVRRRHGELRGRGLRNEQIYPLVGAELAGRRVVPPELSARQLRRIIYG